MAESQFPELIELAKALARHPARLTMWSEGSCASKSGNAFAVSARGATLANLTDQKIAVLEQDKLLEVIATDKVDEETLQAALTSSNDVAPSSDALAMAYLLSLGDFPLAAHTQPVEINQILSSPRARQFADRRISPEEVIACGAASVLVPYADPGLPLAREMKRKILLWKDRYKSAPRLVLIQNHGMVAVGNSTREILKTIEMSIKAAQIFIGAAVLGGPVFLTPGNVSQIESMREL
jgi:rhamnose utilization protein RhaD (predicted bifunctional aldolase and dehydrogenase)